MEEAIVLALILVSVSSYAVWLSINGGSPFGGKRWTTDHTWAPVVAGVGLILFWGSLVDPFDEVLKWFTRFAVGGSIMVIRSLWIQDNQGEKGK